MGPAVKDRLLFAVIGVLLLALTVQMGRYRPAAAVSGPEAAYDALLHGDPSLLAEEWASEGWQFCRQVGDLEYGFQDLDGDGGEELLVQMRDFPQGMNAVFHYNGESVECWELDAVEMSDWREPLTDGTVAHQYFTGGCRSYQIVRYQSNGTQSVERFLFARDEQVDPEDRAPCPYYEIDGREVGGGEFDEALRREILEKRWSRETWTPVPEAPSV